MQNLREREQAKRSCWCTNRQDALSLTVIVLLGLTVRLVFGSINPVLLAGDSPDYFEPAYALLHGKGFPVLTYRGPAYPIFIVLVLLLFGENLEWITAAQRVLGLATAALVYGNGRLLFGRSAGLLAGVATALSGELMVREQYIMSESLLTFELMLAAFLTIVGLRRGPLGWFLAGGLTLGVAVLTRGAALASIAGALPVGVLAYRRWPLIWRAASLTILGSLLILVPWVVRNRILYGTTEIQASGPAALSMVRMVPEMVAYYQSSIPEDPDPRRLAVRKVVLDTMKRTADGGWPSLSKTATWLTKEQGLTEPEVYAIYSEIALEGIHARPEPYVRDVLKSFWQLLTGSSEPLRWHWKIRDQSTGPKNGGLASLLKPITPEQQRWFPVAEVLVKIYQSPGIQPLLLLLALVGAILSAASPAHRAALVLAFLVLSLQGVTAIVGGANTRYYTPIEPHLHVLAAGALMLLVIRLRTRLSTARLPRVARSNLAN